MSDTWDEVAHKALDEEAKPIAADATNLAKYGAPSVGIVTAVLAGVLGDAWNLDPQRSGVVIGAAVIVAAVVLGVYFAFASDIRTRGAVTVARFETIARIRDAELEHDAGAAKEALTAQLETAHKERDEARAALAALKAHDAEALAKALGDGVRIAVIGGE